MIQIKCMKLDINKWGGVTFCVYKLSFNVEHNVTLVTIL